MADLDDFFAKKDRKKGTKGGKKFTTTEELAKKLEETHRREKERVKEKKLLSSQNVDGDGEHRGERKEEEEWKDYEEEKKDYTNLKIQNLQITETPTGEDAEGEDGEPIMEENEAGEMVPRKKQPTGPWNAQQQPQQQQQHQHQEQEPVREVVRPPPPAPSESGDGGGSSGAGGYVPPHMRGGNQSSNSYSPSSSYSSSGYSSSGYSSSMPLSNSRLRSRAAPDITNEAYFPTLSAANSAEPNNVWGRRREEGRGFEEVRNSRTHTATYNPKMAPSGQGPNLSLGNKWDALRDQSYQS
ncbi:protein CDV3 homolog isoform X2 [Frankliniella occidentalis]|uniref:Protein CDV3 homolog isoform X2 n=1 Tax=Frankliniella occidentalis TaxID=133901 RepID=A0A6J1SB72_FRAOC|nr:protein CDV3 homolog isoform X2 [Frankliniella occidentalis]